MSLLFSFSLKVICRKLFLLFAIFCQKRPIQRHQIVKNEEWIPSHISTPFSACLVRSTNEAQTSCSAVVLKGNRHTAPAQLLPTTTNHRPEHLPANLDEMKVTIQSPQTIRLNQPEGLCSGDLSNLFLFRFLSSKWS